MKLVKELLDIYNNIRPLCAQYVHTDGNRQTTFPARTGFLK